MMSNENKKALIAMSGGVDSSVVDKAVMEKIGSGISKVRLSTAPQHECEFKKDKIGKKLYEMFLNLSKDDF